MSTQSRRGLRGALRAEGSVFPIVLKRVVICTAFGFVISSLHSLLSGFTRLGLSVNFPVLGGLIPNTIIALLLIFKIKVAYERFGEGRKDWVKLLNNARNLARHLWISVREFEPRDRAEKIAALSILVAFCFGSKQHLRGDNGDSEIEEFIAPERYLQIKNTENKPIQLAFWLGDYIQLQYARKSIDSYQMRALQELLDKMVDNLGVCERLVKTPVTIFDGIYLRQLVFIFCLSLPFQLVKDFLWLTAPIVALLSFAVFSIEEIANQMENPFGYEDNDLPLDAMCNNLQENVEDLISLEPSVVNVQMKSVKS
jgi:putative membrane protein